MNALKKLPHGLTVEKFLVWADATPGLWCLRDGEPEPMSPPAERPSYIQAEIAGLIGNHLRVIGTRCRVAVGPGVIPLARSTRTMLVPDIAVTCAKPGNARWVSEPVLLIEVLSPSNEASTRANIVAFKTITSVAEIAVIASDDIGAELHRRAPDGTWPERPETIGPDGTLHFRSIGFDMSLAHGYRTTDFAG